MKVQNWPIDRPIPYERNSQFRGALKDGREKADAQVGAENLIKPDIAAAIEKATAARAGGRGDECK